MRKFPFPSSNGENKNTTSPVNDDASAAVQNFNVFISETPVDAEVVVHWGCLSRPHVVARREDDVLFLVGQRQKCFPSITQSLVGDVRHFLIKDVLTSWTKTV